MNIRQATENDLKNIADLHMLCFPDSFSTHLGKFRKGKLLQRYYWEFYNDNPKLFLVAEDDNKIVGLCMGHYSENKYYFKNFLKHNIASICLRTLCLLITGNKKAWKKIKELLKNEKPKTKKLEGAQIVGKYPERERGDLLSICVHNEYRGTGVAAELVDKYNEILKNLGRKVSFLAVEKSNPRGIHFYEKSGYTASAYYGEESIFYFKIL